MNSGAMFDVAITGLVIAIIVPIAIRWLSRDARERVAGGTLAYGGRARRLAALLTVVSAGFILALGLTVPRTKPSDTVGLVAIAAFFAALCVPLILEIFRVRIVFDVSTIGVRSPWSRRRSLAWRHVRIVRWRHVAKFLELSDGHNVVRVSCWLTGLDGFARACNVLLPTDVRSSDQVRSVLELMECGRGAELMWARASPDVLLGRR